MINLQLFCFILLVCGLKVYFLRHIPNRRHKSYVSEAFQLPLNSLTIMSSQKRIGKVIAKFLHNVYYWSKPGVGRTYHKSSSWDHCGAGWWEGYLCLESSHGRPSWIPLCCKLMPRTYALDTQTLLQDFATLFCSIAVVLSNLLHISMPLHHTILPTAYATEHLMLSISEAANH